jgi:hypothetical protein
MIRTLIALVLLVLVAYGCIEAWPLIAGPALVVTSPLNNTSFPGGVVTVTGKASRIALLTLDGASVPHTTDGMFSTTLTFPRGASILTFVATDQFGRHITITRSLFVPD